jgi:hypothetical protein
LRVAAALGTLFLLLLGWTQRDRVLAGRNDFAQLYAGAELAGSGRLYDESANIEVFRRTVGITMQGVLYSRPPFYAALLKPLTLLPYRAAFSVFAALNLAAAIWFAWRFRSMAPELPLFVSFSFPLMAAIINGQDTPILLALCGIAFLLAASGRDFQAGLVLSLCAIKFHLFLPLPFVLLACRRFRILQGGLAGGLALLALSFSMEGFGWVRQYATLLLGSQLNPCIACMPNVKGLANGNAAVELGAAILVVALFAWILWRRVGFELAFGLGIIPGLLLSQHAYIQDATMLLLSFAIIIGYSSAKLLRGLMAITLTPPVYLLLLAKAPYSALVPLLLLALLFVAACTLGAGRENARHLSFQNSSASDLRT